MIKLKDNIIIWLVRKNILKDYSIAKKTFWWLLSICIVISISGYLFKYFFGYSRLIFEIVFWSGMLFINFRSFISISLDYIVRKTRKRYLEKLVGNNQNVEVICGYKDKDLILNTIYEIDNTTFVNWSYPHILLEDRVIALDGFRSVTVFKLLSKQENRRLKLLKLF